MGEKPRKQWVAFGREVRRHRDELGLSQAELGKHLRVSPGMVGHIERAVRVATRDQVDKMEEVFATNGSLLRRWTEIIKNRNIPDWFQMSTTAEK
ncbi:helix-turn-helix transcriptional regulator [Nocardiopsis sp. FR26]|uniref:helix-turn-helix domain-containing protein n=1 Tax=Nocardiopsis sp. FR26 TaxID=2605987 RepID=UPI00135B5C70|nr:helix-turn-helix transcriptional regulator [Nocardiopsis sp. FR26]